MTTEAAADRYATDEKPQRKAGGNGRHDGRTKSAQRIYDGSGLGLALNIRPEQTKSWVQTITINGRRRWIGLGPYPHVSLHEARDKALEHQQLAREGRDPVSERNTATKIPDFRTFAERVIDEHVAKRVSAKSVAQWRSSLAAYAYLTLGRIRIDHIKPRDIESCLLPIWHTKAETASRVLQRITTILGKAVGREYCQLNAGKSAKDLLGSSNKFVQHHPAMPWADVPATVRQLRATDAFPTTKLALEFLILTAARSGEVRGATWDEIDRGSATWTVPASRMKARTEHRVPLADRCLEILEEAKALPSKMYREPMPLVFPSPMGKTLSDSTLSKLVRENAIPGTPHGFRSSFRVWAAEQTDAKHAVMEAALAHTVRNAVERAYSRTDFLEKRRPLMAKWADFVGAG